MKPEMDDTLDHLHAEVRALAAEALARTT